jgi:hypothetical protein
MLISFRDNRGNVISTLLLYVVGHTFKADDGVLMVRGAVDTSRCEMHLLRARRAISELVDSAMRGAILFYFPVAATQTANQRHIDQVV